MTSNANRGLRNLVIRTARAIVMIAFLVPGTRAQETGPSGILQSIWLPCSSKMRFVMARPSPVDVVRDPIPCSAR